MAVNLKAPDPKDLHRVPGVRLGIAMAGVRKANRRDVTVVALDAGSQVAGVFTRNRFCAAPVQLCRQHLGTTLSPRAILVNTGNANAGTGEDGLARAHSTCAALARHLAVTLPPWVRQGERPDNWQTSAWEKPKALPRLGGSQVRDDHF